MKSICSSGSALHANPGSASMTPLSSLSISALSRATAARTKGYFTLRKNSIILWYWPTSGGIVLCDSHSDQYQGIKSLCDNALAEGVHGRFYFLTLGL